MSAKEVKENQVGHAERNRVCPSSPNQKRTDDFFAGRTLARHLSVLMRYDQLHSVTLLMCH